MTKRYEVTRAAVEVQQRTVNPAELEIERLNTLRSRFGLLNKQWIAVSFVHMAVVMMLFSDGSIITTVALLVMVLGIDLALMWLSTYLEIQRRFKQPVGLFPWLAFFFSLFVEWGFNTAALWSHRPSPDVLPEALSKGLAFTFGTFVALIIYVSATIQTRLDRTINFIHSAEAAAQRKRALEEAEQRRQEEEAEHERRRRAREAELRLRQLEAQFSPVESHKEAVEALPSPDPAGQMERRGNGKAAISTSDVPAMLEALREAGVTRLENAAQLRDICGWASYATATRARDVLLAAGVLREDGTGFIVNDEKASL